MTSWCVGFVLMLPQVTLANSTCLFGGTLESGASLVPAYPGKNKGRAWMAEFRDKRVR